jgi:hypothetical protein
MQFRCHGTTKLCRDVSGHRWRRGSDPAVHGAKRYRPVVELRVAAKPQTPSLLNHGQQVLSALFETRAREPSEAGNVAYCFTFGLDHHGDPQRIGAFAPAPHFDTEDNPESCLRLVVRNKVADTRRAKSTYGYRVETFHRFEIDRPGVVQCRKISLAGQQRESPLWTFTSTSTSGQATGSELPRVWDSGTCQGK